jgi:hypothetical protein
MVSTRTTYAPFGETYAASGPQIFPSPDKTLTPPLATTISSIANTAIKAAGVLPTPVALTVADL